MRKKTPIVIAAVCTLLVFTATIIFANYSITKDEISDILNRADHALGNEWKKRSVTTVSDFSCSDNDGNKITYYVCNTVYSEDNTNHQTALNTDAISTIIHPDKAESCHECTVQSLPAAIYQKDGRAYLCWTITPELSCVIKYDPAAVSEKDILHMAESVPANTIIAADS